MTMRECPGFYAVTWRHSGAVCLLDFDDEAVAGRIARDLTEAGRDDVFISGPMLYEIEPEVSERIRLNVLQRLAGENAGLKLRMSELAEGRGS